MRHYDLADRTRNRFTGQVDFVPSDVWMFSVSGGLLHDDYSDTVFGLQKSNGNTFSLAADYQQPNGLGAGATYNFERYTGLQQSHEGDSSDAQFNDPLRNWTSDSTETVHYFSIYATPPRIGRNTEVRFSYDFSHAAGNNLYTIPAGSPITTPNQLPEVFNKLQQLHIDARHRITKNLAATFSYLYEPLNIYRLRVRSQRGQRHRPAQLAGHGVRLPAVHREFVRVRPEISLVVIRRSLIVSGGFMMTLTMRKILLVTALAVAVVFAASPAMAGQDAADQKGRGGLRRPEVPGLPRHRRQGQQEESAGRRRQEAERRRYPSVDYAPDGDGGEGQVHQEAADAGQVRRSARRGPRRAGRLHGEPEVGVLVTRRQALARHPLAIAGAVLTTASAVVFIALLIAMLAGMLSNPYAGLVVFVAIPAVFVVGLLLIPLGMRLQQRKLARDPNAVADDWPVLDFRRARCPPDRAAHHGADRRQHRDHPAGGLRRPALDGIASLLRTGVPHADAAAVHGPGRMRRTGRCPASQCHIGEGAAGFAHAKLSGVRQLLMMPMSSYPQPIPPGAKMPPGAQAQTCGSCHQPGRAVGDRIRVIREYADDEQNSETMTVLQMHLSASTSSQRAIHWHADPAVRVEYVSTDAERQTIPYVKVTDANGQVKEFLAPDTTEQMISTGNRQSMDCIDCHNTVGHPISPTAEQAVDRAIAAAMVSRELPFARREGLRLLKASYASQDDGVRAIESGLRSFYEPRGGSADQQALARTVAAFQDVYRRNVFPTMKVTWGTYPDNKGHVTSNGCFRCHDDSHKAKDGSTISADCELCHKQIR